MGKKRRANCVLNPGSINAEDLISLFNMSDDFYQAFSLLGFPSGALYKTQRWRCFSWKTNKRYSHNLNDWCTRAG